MAQDPTVTVLFRIIGRVQGIGYRAWAMDRALGLGLNGWVRNVSDGSVEVMARGPAGAVDVFFAAAHAGPDSCRVTEVRREAAKPEEAAALLPGFHQVATRRS